MSVFVFPEEQVMSSLHDETLKEFNTPPRESRRSEVSFESLKGMCCRRSLVCNACITFPKAARDLLIALVKLESNCFEPFESSIFSPSFLQTCPGGARFVQSLTPSQVDKLKLTHLRLSIDSSSYSEQHDLRNKPQVTFFFDSAYYQPYATVTTARSCW